MGEAADYHGKLEAYRTRLKKNRPARRRKSE